MKRFISDILVERYILGELNADQTKEFQLLEISDSEFKARVESLRASNVEILNDYPAPFFTERIRTALPQTKKLKNKKRSPFLLWSFGLSSVLLASVWGFILINHSNVTPTNIQSDNDTIILKGDTADLTLYRKTASGGEKITDGSPAREGDSIQISYRSSKPYGMILSIDGRGTITYHLPKSVLGAAKIKIGQTVLLDQSYTLDDAPMYERFVFAVSDSPIDAKQILTAVKSSKGEPSKLQKIPGVYFSLFSLTKVK